MPRLALAAVTIALFWPALCLAPGPRLAHGETPPPSLDACLQKTFEGDSQTSSTATLLDRVGMRYRTYLTVELLSDAEEFLVETELIWKDWKLRFPVKVSRSETGRWQTVWLPDRTYVESLVELLSDESIVATIDEKSDAWTDTARMPALPIIVDSRGAHTPFGSVPLDESQGLHPPEQLGTYIRRWIDDVVGGDPGPAGIDILASAKTPWRNMTQILFGAASAGLFRVHLVTRDAESTGLSAIPLLAPVFESGRSPEQSTSFVAGMYRSDPAHFRIAAAGRRLTADAEDCPPKMSLCPANPEAFAAELPKLVRESFDDRAPQISHVMFAATGSVTLDDALPYLLHLPEALGIPRQKLFLGHIGATNADDRRHR